MMATSTWRSRSDTLHTCPLVFCMRVKLPLEKLRSPLVKLSGTLYSPSGSADIQLPVAYPDGISRQLVQLVGLVSFDGGIVGNIIDTIVEPQPQVLVIIKEKTEDIIVLQAVDA